MEKSKIKKIALFTSGGDSPGMNAAIRAVVRSALFNGLEVYGICRGYDGLVQGDFFKMEANSVANIIQRGGTILKTARSKEFLTQEGRAQAYNHLINHQIDALIAIGGDGTFSGALKFSSEYNFPILGIPGTIDNDLLGTDFAIGYDTAINTVIEAVDKLRDTAESHDRLFVVEVMGRDSGLIALRAGIGSGAEGIIIPELKSDIEIILEKLEKTRKNKSSRIIMVAEGDEGGAFSVAERIKSRFPNYDVRVSVLGHIQRGGRPTCMDRVLASRLGVAAVEGLLEGRKNEMVGIINGNICYTHFEKATKHLGSQVNQQLLNILHTLST